MSDLGKRLAQARRQVGFHSASEAARALGMPVPTYSAHENGSRAPERETAQKYARRFKVSLDWLLNGRDAERAVPMVPLVGYVGAGAEAHFYSDAQGPFDEVPAVEGATDKTVAVEIRGDSLGSFFDHALVYYDDMRAEVSPDMIGKLCVVGLSDGRVLVKKIRRGRGRAVFNLYGQFGEPIYDVPVEWAARVRNMVPR